MSISATVLMTLISQCAPGVSPETMRAIIMTESGGNPYAIANVTAAGYALSCTADSPLFFLTWYGAGIMFSAIAGALVGGRLLRW